MQDPKRRILTTFRHCKPRSQISHLPIPYPIDNPTKTVILGQQKALHLNLPTLITTKIHHNFILKLTILPKQTFLHNIRRRLLNKQKHKNPANLNIIMANPILKKTLNLSNPNKKVHIIHR